MNPEAEAISGELVREMAKAEPLPLSLYGILEDLRELEQMREEAEADGDAPAEAAASTAIREYIGSQVLGKKMDGIVHHIKHWREMAALAEREGKRLLALSKRCARDADRLESDTVYAMQAHGVKEIRIGDGETRQNSVRVQRDGGMGKLEVDDVAALPDEFVRRSVTLTLTDHEWSDLGIWLGKYQGGLHWWHRILDLLERAKPEEDNTAIRKALKERVTCPECKGSTLGKPATQMQDKDCPRCEGKGTVPRTLPGVRIKERSWRLVTE